MAETKPKKTSAWDKVKAFGRKLRDKAWPVLTDRVWPKIKELYLKWYDIIVLLPVALILFIFNESWIRLIDQTAASMSLEFLAILNFNVLKLVLINVFGYIIYNLYFHDYFDKGWEKKVGNPVVAAILQLVLWLSTVGLSAFVILQGLSM